MALDFRANKEAEQLIQKLSYDMNVDNKEAIIRSLILMKHVVNATIAGNDVVIKEKSGEERKIIVM